MNEEVKLTELYAQLDRKTREILGALGYGEAEQNDVIGKHALIERFEKLEKGAQGEMQFASLFRERRQIGKQILALERKLRH